MVTSVYISNERAVAKSVNELQLQDGSQAKLVHIMLYNWIEKGAVMARESINALRMIIASEMKSDLKTNSLFIL
ncbi:MAG: hypothetical protein H7328_12285 [Bdellovibrio sp.]|nr:hypothetical protein [Bdellovibrio sp.]